ncbi:MAG: hypothetical protein WEA31_02620 [Pirellulales bacterium]
MESLNRAAAQAADLFRSMTLGARLVAGLLLVVIVISLTFLFQMQAGGPGEYLFGAEPIALSQMPVMEQAFAVAGLNEYVIEGNRIRVPAARRNEYIAALAAESALPPEFHKVLDQAVTSTGPFTDKLTKEQLIKSARQTQLSMIIREMKGIEQAMVLYDTVEKPGLRRERIMTASVSVKPSGNSPLDEEQVPALRNIVASSIAGLDPKNVTVTDLNTNRNYHVANDGPLGDAAEDAYGKRKQMYERQWQQKIAAGLTMVPGAVVTVNVELDPLILKRDSEVQLDPKTVAIRRSEKGIIKTNETGGPGGRPGLQAQAGGPATAPLVANSSSGRSDLEETESEETNAVGQRTSVTENAPLTPQRVKVALGIPSSYVASVWRQRNPTPEGEPPVQPDENALAQIQADVVEQLERHVANLIPQGRAAQDTRPDINVTIFPDIQSDVELPEITALAEAASWFGGNWSMLGMCGLGLLSLLMLRSMVRGTAPTEPPHENSQRILPIDTPLEGVGADEQTAEKRLRRRLENGPSLKDELAELVREDPTAAANILKTWIGNAG